MVSHEYGLVFRAAGHKWQAMVFLISVQAGQV